MTHHADYAGLRSSYGPTYAGTGNDSSSSFSGSSCSSGSSCGGGGGCGGCGSS
jgi:hypothetical protein